MIDLKEGEWVKKRKIVSIDFIFIIYMIIATIITIAQETNLTEIIEGLKETGNVSPGLVLQLYVALIFFGIFLTIVKNIYVILIYIGIKIGRRMYKKQKLSQNDFQQTKEYYREILQGYSPAVLSFIDDFEIEYPSTIIASLLQLSKNHFITMEQGSIKKNTNEKLNDTNLESNETYILNHMKDDKVILNDIEFKKNLTEDALKKGLIKNIQEEKAKRKKKIIKAIIIMFVIFFVTFIAISVIEKLNITEGILVAILFFIIAILLMGTVFYPFVLMISYAVYLNKNQKCPYVRTEKGEEINKKLEGLKIYLKDYSYLEEKKESEVAIWEEYLVYSVLFNQNTKIIETYRKYIEIE